MATPAVTTLERLAAELEEQVSALEALHESGYKIQAEVYKEFELAIKTMQDTARGMLKVILDEMVRREKEEQSSE